MKAAGPALSRRIRLRAHAVATVGVCFVLASACANPEDAGSGPSVRKGSKAEVVVQRDATLYAMVPDSSKKAGRIRVATNAPFAPFEMFAGPVDKKLIGLEIDLGHALGQRLGVPFEFSQQPFDGLIPGLQAKKYDLLMAALFDTKEREKTIDFVNYGRSGSALLVEKGNPKNITTLGGVCGYQAATQTGAQQVALLKKQSDQCVKGRKKAITIKSFPQFSDALLALKTGKADTILGDLPALRYAAKQDGTVETVEDPAAPSGYEPAPVGIGVPKDQPEFREAVRRAMADLMSNGSYRKILDDYDVPQMAVDKPSVNQSKE